jgi:photosystem II stability/assembly factor-like uncharacterized protein
MDFGKETCSRCASVSHLVSSPVFDGSDEALRRRCATACAAAEGNRIIIIKKKSIIFQTDSIDATPQTHTK